MHVLTYFIMISCTKYGKNILVGSPAVLVRDKIHCNKYPSTRRVMSVGYPSSKISTRFNPTTSIGMQRICVMHVVALSVVHFYCRLEILVKWPPADFVNINESHVKISRLEYFLLVALSADYSHSCQF